jgi:hypothetical protein
MPLRFFPPSAPLRLCARTLLTVPMRRAQDEPICSHNSVIPRWCKGESSPFTLPHPHPKCCTHAPSLTPCPQTTYVQSWCKMVQRERTIGQRRTASGGGELPACPRGGGRHMFLGWQAPPAMPREDPHAPRSVSAKICAGALIRNGNQFPTPLDTTRQDFSRR